MNCEGKMGGGGKSSTWRVLVEFVTNYITGTTSRATVILSDLFLSRPATKVPFERRRPGEEGERTRRGSDRQNRRLIFVSSAQNGLR